MNDFEDYTILIIDDEKDILDNLFDYLKMHAFNNVLTAKNLKEANFKLLNHQIHLIILDVMLPDGSGLDFLKQLRSHSNVPVIILSALDGRDDKRAGFLNEADDYMVKPFLPEELLWKIKAILRRSYKESDEAQVYLGNVIFDRQKAVIINQGVEESLTAKQFKILDLLALNLNKIVSIDAILEAVWQDSYGYGNTLMTHIYRLREKLEVDPSNPKILVTVRGLGYKLMGSVKKYD
ncbi:two-component system response regulator [Aerococcus urinaehominis]|uniref:Two-component system response regulator n=1 Tax=Aerococcus urinaehominis TaxID=128944 RepID=A0A109RGI5_9LACT|nr:response regulator transcription factor [Aerococcus urinaehominis]AMB98721.1 two-component system response regulator [Aerococcus urinaehominis]SDM00082.1 DNA-binding response regulator, OmpR family, contains REC and winged-helix (wHTH) domain [Aerococcus urinaehominis]